MNRVRIRNSVKVAPEAKLTAEAPCSAARAGKDNRLRARPVVSLLSNIGGHCLKQAPEGGVVPIDAPAVVTGRADDQTDHGQSA